MEPGRNPQYFSERSQVLSLEGAFQRLAIFFGFSSFLLTGALLYTHVKEEGLDLHMKGDLFMVLLGIVTLINVAIFFLMHRYRGIWQRIEKEAGLDKVTGVMNRIHFEKLLEEELRRGGRYHYPITLCYLDLDEFKNYNEEFNRDRGNAALKKFAEVLRSSVRFADCVARYQNDEFCVLLPHTDIVRAEKFMGRLLMSTAERMEFTFSAGVTSYQAGENKAQFVMRAVSSLAQAKREGKKQIRYAVAESSSPAGFQNE